MQRRPYTGARIETARVIGAYAHPRVAPTQGRGLKRVRRRRVHVVIGRPYTGARIETSMRMTEWASSATVAPTQGRGLKRMADGAEQKG